MSAHLIAEWREAMGYLLAVLAGGPKREHRNEDSEFARDAKERRHYSAIAARAATVDLVDVVKAARADAFSVRKLALRLAKGDLLELDDVIELWEDVRSIVDGIEASEPSRRNKPAMQSKDTLAVALVEAWSDPESASYRPAGFGHDDVAKALGCTRQALINKYEDGRLRCPRYMRLMRDRRARE